MTIGHVARAADGRHSSKPSMPGSMMSISTTSAGVAVERLERLLAAAGLVDGPALVLERQLHRRADALVVLDGQDAGSHGSHDASGRGSGVSRRLRRRAARPSARTAPGWRRAPRSAATGPPSKSPVRHPASRAISSPAARSHGPRPLLEVGVDAAGGDAAQVGRGRAEAADVADLGDQLRRTARPGRGAARRGSGSRWRRAPAPASVVVLQRIGAPLQRAPCPRDRA